MRDTMRYAVLASFCGMAALWGCGCVRCSPRLYARDLASGWLIGPFEPRIGVDVQTTRGAGFVFTEPHPGELEVMAKLKSTKIDISADEDPLPLFVDKLMAAQREAVGPEQVVPISLLDDGTAYTMPKVTINLHGAPLFLILRTVQLRDNPPSFGYRITGKGVSIWPVHPVPWEPRESRGVR